ncbi:hypothetical protein VTK26DRAFT_1977 [Humicola hyalothermophila]
MRDWLSLAHQEVLGLPVNPSTPIIDKNTIRVVFPRHTSTFNPPESTMDCVIFSCFDCFSWALARELAMTSQLFCFSPGIRKQTRRLGVGTIHTPLFRLDQDGHWRVMSKDRSTTASVLAQPWVLSLRPPTAIYRHHSHALGRKHFSFVETKQINPDDRGWIGGRQAHTAKRPAWFACRIGFPPRRVGRSHSFGTTDDDDDEELLTKSGLYIIGIEGEQMVL